MRLMCVRHTIFRQAFVCAALLAGVGVAAEPAVTRHKGHDGWAGALAVSPSGQRLLTGGEDGRLHLWDVTDTGPVRQTALRFPHAVTAVAWLPAAGAARAAGQSVAESSAKEERAAVGLWNGGVQVVDLAGGRAVRTLAGHRENITSLAVQAGGRRFASGGGDDCWKLWDVASGRELLAVPQGNEYDVSCLAFSPNGKFVATGDGENRVVVWDASSGRELLALSEHREAISAVAFTPDGKRVVSGSWDDTLLVWDAATGAVVQTLRGHEDDIRALAISPDGRQLASTSEDRTLRLWSLETGRELRRLGQRPAALAAVAYLPAGRRLVASGRGELECWTLP